MNYKIRHGNSERGGREYEINTEQLCKIFNQPKEKLEKMARENGGIVFISPLLRERIYNSE